MLRPSTRFHGIAVSGGIVIGKAHVIEHRPMQLEPYVLREDQVEEEIARFRRAVEMAQDEVREVRTKVAEAVEERQAAIFDAHLMILSDPMIIDKTIDRIRKEHTNAEFVFSQIVEDLADRLARIQDQFFSQRNNDYRDVARRVLNNLMSLDGAHLEAIDEAVVVIANDLGPSDTAQMIRSSVLGFCTNLGSRTSHTAIMAKALEIPAVVGLGDVTQSVRTGDLVILDGNSGSLILNPSESEREFYERLIEEYGQFKALLGELRDLPATTLDGHTIHMMANLELPEEIEHVTRHGGEGIGLFRTEFIYIDREHLPDEGEQREVYRRVLDAMGTQPVVFRTLDLGGDKFASSIPIDELNPFLGLRALRLCLENPDVFATQLRALLTASGGKVLQILFPMVSGIEEYRRAREFTLNVQKQLIEEGQLTPSEIKFGVMIEIPSAALTSDVLAREVDFFSIGTNDLVQYTLAVDRVNKHVSMLYEPLHPAVLRLIRLVVSNARERKVPVCVCGEMAAEPEMAALLIGLGVDELSMGPVSIPIVKRMLRSVRMSDLKELADEILTLSSAVEVRATLGRRMSELAPGAMDTTTSMGVAPPTDSPAPPQAADAPPEPPSSPSAAGGPAEPPPAAAAGLAAPGA